MPTEVAEVDRLRDYLNGVMARADHHANNVNEIALAVVGAIIWRKDAASIEVMEHNGELKNVLWVWIGGSKYAFSYSHPNGAIEIRRRTTRGAVLHSVTNATSLSEVRTIFQSL